MKLLLDTQAFLWFAGGDRRLTPRARRRIEDVRHDKFLSIASVWEMAIKTGLGKLVLDLPLAELIESGAIENGIGLLPIDRRHALGVASLPPHHGDPFDRLLAVQARDEDMAVVGGDAAFDAYGVRRIW
ncbi:MAG: type II toxin-antitoxin system VapC family toxin [Planctomycetes bacterium]|nr:type II toxin-antitoxin system VapC family toxin [Planctomycetota bacterium]